MANAAPNPTNLSAPEPQFWVRYSPHSEFSISGLTSLAWHVSILVLLVVAGFVISRGSTPDMPIDTMDLSDNPGGGGGDPNGTFLTPQKGSPRIERASRNELPPDLPTPNNSMGALPDVRNTPSLPELPDRTDADRVIDDAKAAKAELDRAGRTPGPAQSAGRGGPGTGGGQGAGQGTGNGAGAGDGAGSSVRAKRNVRWRMLFNTSNGDDYLRQLAACGAILVAEMPDGQEKMFRRLSQRPVPEEAVDPQTTRGKLSWVDESPTALADLGRSIGLSVIPHAIRVYFPYTFEQELLKKELAFRNLREEQIHSTVFRLMMQGNRHEVVVVEQRVN